MNIHRKKIIISLIISIITIVAMTIPSATLAAQQRASLEGVWDSQVTLTDCNGFTLVAFEGYLMFNRGGTLSVTDNAYFPLHGPGFGTWQCLGGRHFTGAFQFFNFNPDGSFAGVQKITPWTITLAANGNRYTSVFSFASYDPNGNLLISGCGAETATRLP